MKKLIVLMILFSPACNLHAQAPTPALIVLSVKGNVWTGPEKKPLPGKLSEGDILKPQQSDTINLAPNSEVVLAERGASPVTISYEKKKGIVSRFNLLKQYRMIRDKPADQHEIIHEQASPEKRTAE